MGRFQAVWLDLSGWGERPPGARHSRAEEADRDQRTGEPGADALPSEDQEDATVKAASAMAEKLLHRRLTERQKKVAGPAVHYAFSTILGGLYGMAAEVTPRVTAGFGLAFGTIVWLVGDEIMVPLFGLSKGPTEYPMRTHAYALASHFVYGSATEGVRQVLRRAL